MTFGANISLGIVWCGRNCFTAALMTASLLIINVGSVDPAEVAHHNTLKPRRATGCDHHISYSCSFRV
jgi:hypothetical protein